MSTDKPKPDSSTDYEATGTAILADYAVAEMRKSVARLRQELRSAFRPENATPVPTREARQD